RIQRQGPVELGKGRLRLAKVFACQATEELSEVVVVVTVLRAQGQGALEGGVGQRVKDVAIAHGQRLPSGDLARGAQFGPVQLAPRVHVHSPASRGDSLARRLG